MAIETLEDIVEDLLDKIGTYGAHDDHKCTEDRPCRSCASSALTDRIKRAAEIERKLRA